MIHACANNKSYYFVLILILFLGFSLGIVVSADKQLQMVVVLLTAFFYLVWGILHHRLHHDLSLKIVIEYVLIGSLGMSVVFFLLRGGSL